MKNKKIISARTELIQHTIIALAYTLYYFLVLLFLPLSAAMWLLNDLSLSDNLKLKWAY
jgi:ABC-type sulfate transport system permease component